MTSDVSRLCPACWAAYQAWAGYRLPPRPRISNDSMRDMSAAGVVERRRLRFEEWRDTVNWQQSLIRRLCVGHEPEAVPSPCGDQFVLDLGVTV